MVHIIHYTKPMRTVTFQGSCSDRDIFGICICEAYLSRIELMVEPDSCNIADM